MRHYDVMLWIYFWIYTWQLIFMQKDTHTTIILEVVLLVFFLVYSHHITFISSLFDLICSVPEWEFRSSFRCDM